MGRHRRFHAGGFTLIEVLFAVAVATALVGVALPITGSAIDKLRTPAAARYLAGRIGHGRMDTIRRSTSVALRFEPSSPDCAFTPYADGSPLSAAAARRDAGDAASGLHRAARRSQRRRRPRRSVPPAEARRSRTVPGCDGGAYRRARCARAAMRRVVARPARRGSPIGAR
jgi:Tfp pilus assembly protein FimT